ncbi:MAG: iron chaperone [Cyclobacteriaceae bacterium]
MKDPKDFKTVKDYLANQPEMIKEALNQLIDCIYEAEPNAIEMINYNIPAYALIEGGKRDQQIMIAGYKSHVGFYPHPTVMKKFDKELKDYKKGKGSVQFPIDRPLPKQLIVKMVRYRLELIKEG